MKIFFHIYLSMLAFAAVMATDDNTSCDLDCPRNAPCRFGHADFSGRKDVLTVGMERHRIGMHCDCPIGWTGILCDKKYETCTNQNGHECYNGGECILGLQDKYGNEQLFCDCSNANGFVGKYCETPFEQICSSGHQKGDSNVFCVNGGECNPDFPESSSQPCFCDEGWEGYNCEYKKTAVPECTLDCQNEGICFLGIAAKGHGTKHNQSRPLQEVEDQMFCSCLSGFGGRLCQARAEQCGSSHDHVCFNGGKCVTTSVQTPAGVIRSQHHCDCATATNDSNDRFAGIFCEHKATSMCSNNDWTLFCTQGGTCKRNPMEGCICPNGTTGYQCEFSTEHHNKEIVAHNGSNSVLNEKEEGIQEDDYIYDYNQEGVSSSKYKNMEECGDGFCLNGGYCVFDQIFLPDGTYKMREYCDCSQASDDNSNYAGRYCQYKSTSLCFVENNSPDSVDETFCVHHGVCQDDGSCDCPGGWTGQFCELKTLEIDQYSEDKRDIKKNIDDGSFDFDLEACGETYCYNGGTCVETERLQSSGSIVIDMHCDCSTAFDEEHLYAGTSCEFPSTQICSILEGGESLEGSSFCTNHGACVFDRKFDCECQPGFFGNACEYESHTYKNNFYDREEEDKDIEVESCGHGVCQNGGTCNTSTTYSDETKTIETIYSCDCSTAFDDERAYLGPSCEYPSTSICESPRSGEPLSSAQFCVNDGTCKQDPSKGCDCDVGFAGKFCQLETKFNEKNSKNIDDGGNNQDIEVCGDDHICLHGSRCITSIVPAKNGGEVEVRECDCDLTSTAGDSCQYHLTDICTIGDNYPSQPLSFCVNGGRCNAWVFEGDTDPGCDCPESYIGTHCELNIAMEKNQVSDSKRNNVTLIAGCLLGLLGVFALFIIFILRSRIRMTVKHRANNMGVKKGISVTGKQRRRRVAGFNGLPNRNPTVSTIEMSSSGEADIDQIVFDYQDDNEGMVNDHFEDERPTIKNPVFVANSSVVKEEKVRCPHFV